MWCMAIRDPIFAWQESGASRGKSRTFVIHGHHASPLRFALRLEMEDTLRSWAVFKGPSLDPAVKRRALLLEDHPLTSVPFHDLDPAGSSGANDLYVWDAGHYIVTGGSATAGFDAGDLQVTLHGHTLCGGFRLVRLPHQQRPWLLLKVDDDFAIAGWILPLKAQIPDHAHGRITRP